jgi:hypothetical protein
MCRGIDIGIAALALSLSSPALDWLATLVHPHPRQRTTVPAQALIVSLRTIPGVVDPDSYFEPASSTR